MSWYFGEGHFWFRIFGYGISIKKLSINRHLFSERNGYTKHLDMFGLCFKGLKR